MEQPDDPATEKEIILGIFAYVLKRIITISEDCVGDRSNRQALACAVYHGAILSDVQAVFLLLANNLTFSVPKLLRSMLESVVSIRSISKDIEYIDYLIFESVHKKRKHLARVDKLSKTEKYAGKLTIERESIDLLDTMLIKYSCKWKEPYKIEKKFILADLQYMYDLSYASLSENVHSMLTNLASCFQSSHKDGPMVSILNQVDAETIAAWVEIALVTLVDSTDCLCSICSYEPGIEIDEAKWSLLQFQKRYFKSHCAHPEDEATSGNTK